MEYRKLCGYSNKENYNDDDDGNANGKSSRMLVRSPSAPSSADRRTSNTQGWNSMPLSNSSRTLDRSNTDPSSTS
jgi:hypothetical protein